MNNNTSIKTLNQLLINPGMSIMASFVKKWIPYPFKNDFMPATIKEIRKNGKVLIEWNHLIDNKFHPSAVIKPEYILVEA